MLNRAARLSRRAIRSPIFESLRGDGPAVVLHAAAGMIPAPLVFTRASGGAALRGGTLVESGLNVARFADVGLAIEGARTNFHPNGRMEGASPGAPGAPAANMGFVTTSGSGLTRQISVGVEDGIAFTDHRFFGTATAVNIVLVALVANLACPAVAGETVTGSVFASVFGPSLPATSALRLVEGGAAVFSATDVPIAQSPTAPPLRSSRLSVTRTITDASTTDARFNIVTTNANGQVLDFTVRVAGTQLEKAPFASSPILAPPGSPAATTRAEDILSAPWASVSRGNALSVLLSAVVPAGAQAPRTLFSAFTNANNRVSLRSSASNQYAITHLNAGNTVVSPGLFANTGTDFDVRIGMTFAPGRCAAFQAGGALQAVTQALPALSTFRVGARDSGLDPGFLSVRSLRLFPRAMSDAELVSRVNRL